MSTTSHENTKGSHYSRCIVGADPTYEETASQPANKQANKQTKKQTNKRYTQSQQQTAYNDQKTNEGAQNTQTITHPLIANTNKDHTL